MPTPGGSLATDTDACYGHTETGYGYHYHSRTINNGVNGAFLGCFRGKRAVQSFDSGSTLPAAAAPPPPSPGYNCQTPTSQGCCGDGVCNGPETHTLCPGDCPAAGRRALQQLPPGVTCPATTIVAAHVTPGSVLLGAFSSASATSCPVSVPPPSGAAPPPPASQTSVNTSMTIASTKVPPPSPPLPPPTAATPPPPPVSSPALTSTPGMAFSCSSGSCATNTSAYASRALTYAPVTGVFTGTMTVNGCPATVTNFAQAMGSCTTVTFPASAYASVGATGKAAPITGNVGYTLMGMNIYNPLENGFNSNGNGPTICSTSGYYCAAGTDLATCIQELYYTCGANQVSAVNAQVPPSGTVFGDKCGGARSRAPSQQRTAPPT